MKGISKLHQALMDVSANFLLGDSVPRPGNVDSLIRSNLFALGIAIEGNSG
jgi:hypothetical protein